MFYANYVMLFYALYSATTDLGLPCCFIVLAGFFAKHHHDLCDM